MLSSPGLAKSGLLAGVLAGVLAGGVASCGLPASTLEELVRFERAGPFRPRVDIESIARATLASEPYRVVPGDILEFQMLAVMRAASPDASVEPGARHLSRVTSDGKVTLPLIGELEVAGKTLEEIERAAVAEYHPRFIVQQPSIVAMVLEHRTVKVSVAGAVTAPGIYSLASDERSLVAALMKAGGIEKDGASAVRIFGAGGQEAGEPIVLPVEGLNIPFADVALEGGEIIEVLRLDPEVFTVVGLVSRPGTYEYPPGARYSLLQAIGFGGGVDITSDPHYAQVFRQDASGEIVAATFYIGGDGLQEAAMVEIRQGDIIAVADTARTQIRRFLSGVFRGGFFVGAQHSI